MLKLQRDGKCASREKAFIAAKLIEMQFEEEDALLASRQCNTVYHAVKFLTQLCEMCNCRFPINLVRFIFIYFLVISVVWVTYMVIIIKVTISKHCFLFYSIWKSYL